MSSCNIHEEQGEDVSVHLIRENWTLVQGKIIQMSDVSVIRVCYTVGKNLDIMPRTLAEEVS